MEANVIQKSDGATLKDISAAARERRWRYVRRGGGGGDRDAYESEYGAGSDGYWYAGTETGDSQVGKLSCVDARRKYIG